MGHLKFQLLPETLGPALIKFSEARFSSYEKNKEQRISKLMCSVDGANLVYIKRNCRCFQDVAYNFWANLPRVLGRVHIKDVSQIFLAFDMPKRPSPERSLVAENRAMDEESLNASLAKLGQVTTERIQKIMDCKNPTDLDDKSLWPGDDGYSLLFKMKGFKLGILVPYLRYRTEVDEKIRDLLCVYAQYTKIITRGLISEQAPDGNVIPDYRERQKEHSYGTVEVFDLSKRKFLSTDEYDGLVTVGSIESDNPPLSMALHWIRSNQRTDILLLSNDSDMGVCALLLGGLLRNSDHALSHLQGLYFHVECLVPKQIREDPGLCERDTYDLKKCHELLQARANEMVNVHTYLEGDMTTMTEDKLSFTQNFVYLFCLFLGFGGNDYVDGFPKLDPRDWLDGLNVYLKNRGQFRMMPAEVLKLSEGSRGYLRLIEIDRQMFETGSSKEPYLNRYAFLHLTGFVLSHKYPKFRFLPALIDQGGVPESRRKDPVSLSVGYVLRVINNAFRTLLYYIKEMLPNAQIPKSLDLNPDLSGFEIINGTLRPKIQVDPLVNLSFVAEAYINPSYILSNQKTEFLDSLPRVEDNLLKKRGAVDNVNWKQRKQLKDMSDDRDDDNDNIKKQ